jgi:hypothetical protein
MLDIVRLLLCRKVDVVVRGDETGVRRRGSINVEQVTW